MEISPLQDAPRLPPSSPVCYIPSRSLPKESHEHQNSHLALLHPHRPLRRTVRHPVRRTLRRRPPPPPPLPRPPRQPPPRTALPQIQTPPLGLRRAHGPPRLHRRPHARPP